MQCGARTTKGQRCRMQALKGADRCFNHAPEAARQRAAARRKGGRRTRIGKAATPAQVGTIQDLQGHVGRALADCLRLANTLRRAGTVARLVAVAVRLIEVGEHEQRMAVIEERLSELEVRQ